MFALDFISNGKPNNNGPMDGEHIITPTRAAGMAGATAAATNTTRARSNSMTSSVSDGVKTKPPHTEGHIKWLTTVYVVKLYYFYYYLCFVNHLQNIINN